ncbi:Ppx/GppA phosphatase family protein [Actinomycetaceae bacterium MB13-C1-2]|nr:Ppx/GppA phosphatase family protein [Actinomycetaceae bacterium MB13-C1-2]
MSQKKRVAAIDCGTNSIRLLIADATGDGILDVAREMTITRLGQGVDRTGVLDPQAIERTLNAARAYTRQIEEAGVEAGRFVTTSASRDAANRDEFLVPIKEITGFDPQVLTGNEEAELSFLGALSAMPTTIEGPYLLTDIGGGSTEFVLGDDRVLQSVSIDMGSVRVSERFGGEPWTEEKLTQARAWIDQKLDEAEKVVNFSRARSLVGVAGTVTSIGALVAGAQEYDPVMTHGITPTAEQWADAVKFLVSASVEDKAALGFMPPGRADVIGGGALIWERILNRFGVLDEQTPGASGFPVVISEHDILDGLALSLVG